MMKINVALVLLTLSLPCMATVKIEEEVFVTGQRPEIVKELIDSGSVEVDHVSSEGFELYGSKGLKTYLDQKNIFYFDMKLMNKKMMADYPSYTQITTSLQELAQRYPKIMRLFSIGKTVKGRSLWMMKISDNVNLDEIEPEFKYISSMHGDEITGRELMINLIQEIGQKYGSDTEITNLINNTEIYVMPSMNPDGSELRQRANANGTDLNRNFPDILRDRDSTSIGREVENQAVMKFQAERHFALSANFHGGVIVANYPWDSTYDRHPLDAFVKELSIGYAELNPEMRNSSEFPLGVTNGADWYVVKGGMQDWSYFWHQDLQITVELSYAKWPSYHDIPDFYANNRDSLIFYMKQVHRGAGFKFAKTNAEGVVSITQISPEKKDFGNYAFSSSEFYKVMPEGKYRFSIKEKNGSVKDLEVEVRKDEIGSNGNFALLN